MIEVKGILTENEKRYKTLFEHYDPIKGVGSPIERFKLVVDHRTYDYAYWLPMEMESIPLIQEIRKYKSVVSFILSIDDKADIDATLVDLMEEILRTRIFYDFEFWAITCVMIQDKESENKIFFKLRRAQRRLLARLEKMRLANVPIRIILLKARQWGGSTLIQMYMAWIQLFRKKRWHSTIVTQVENQAKYIRSMYSFMGRNHPKSVKPIIFRPFEQSHKNKVIDKRECIVSVGSAEKPDSLRTFDLRMVHMSEVGLWGETAAKGPKDLVQAIRGGIHRMPYTLIAMESTAKGVGNFFHTEWLDAESGKSGYDPIFIPWFDIEIYVKPIEDYEDFINKMSPRDWELWEQGATLEGICWYNEFKNQENYDDWRMCSEYPSNAKEAFQNTDTRAFAPQYVENCRKNNREPIFKGEIFADGQSGWDAFKNIRFEPTPNGSLWIWAFPDKTKFRNRYVIPVDIGGRTIRADYSVIRVIDRYWILDGGIPEAIVTWRGHLDQDLVVWKAAQIAYAYHNGLLVPESNSLDTEEQEGNHFITVLDELENYYENIYTRTDPELVVQGAPKKLGWFTGSKSKVALVDNQNKVLRLGDQKGGYKERDKRVCDEYDSYMIKANGTYGSVKGMNDDLAMTTMIGLKVSDSMDMPKEVRVRSNKPRKITVSESTI